MQHAAYIFVCLQFSAKSICNNKPVTLDFKTDDDRAHVMLSSVFSARTFVVLLMTT
jgi:hypothetical protein